MFNISKILSEININKDRVINGEIDVIIKILRNLNNYNSFLPWFNFKLDVDRPKEMIGDAWFNSRFMKYTYDCELYRIVEGHSDAMFKIHGVKVMQFSFDASFIIAKLVKNQLMVKFNVKIKFFPLLGILMSKKISKIADSYIEDMFNRLPNVIKENTL